MASQLGSANGVAAAGRRRFGLVRKRSSLTARAQHCSEKTDIENQAAAKGGSTTLFWVGGGLIITKYIHTYMHAQGREIGHMPIVDF